MAYNAADSNSLGLRITSRGEARMALAYLAMVESVKTALRPMMTVFKELADE